MFLCELRLLVKSKIMLASTAILAVVMIKNLDIKEVYDLEYLRDMRKTTLTMLLASANNGAVAAGAVFAMVTVFILSKDRRKQGKCIIQAGGDYINIMVSRVAAIIVYAIGSVEIGVFSVYLAEVFGYKVHYYFYENVYTYNVIVLATAIFSILICSGVYMMLESIYVSILVFSVFFLVGTTSGNYLLLWVKSNTNMYSDFAGIEAVMKYLNYNRLLWTCISSAIFFAGILCLKKYDLDVLKSIFADKRKKFMLLLIPLLAVVTCVLYVNEPYVLKKAVADYLTNGGKVNHNIFLSKVTAKTRFYTGSQGISVEAKYAFVKEHAADYVDFKGNTGLKIKWIRVNEKKCSFASNMLEGFNDSGNIRIHLPRGENARIEISYSGRIKDFSGGAESCITSKDIYLLENYRWLFEPMADAVSKIKYDMTYVAPKDLQVVSIGKLQGVKKYNSLKEWRYKAESREFCPGAFAARYEVKKFRVGTADVKLFYSKKHETRVKKLGIEKCIKNIISYYESKIGEYPFNRYPLNIVETPVYKSGGHSTLNVVTVCESGFNQGLDLEDYARGYEGKISLDSIRIFAHEVSHQWWGGGVESVTEFPFSNEGFATYYAYKYMEHYSGESCRNEYEEWKRVAESIKHEKVNPNDFRLLYEIMPYKLVNLEKRIGEKEVLQTLSSLYNGHCFGSLKYKEFLNAFSINRGKF